LKDLKKKNLIKRRKAATVHLKRITYVHIRDQRFCKDNWKGIVAPHMKTAKS
jgi:hypothetical protein